MNWDEYFASQDPYYTNAPSQEPVIRNPRYTDYPEESIRPQTGRESLYNTLTDIYPGRATMDYLATGQGKPDVLGDIGGDLAGGIGKLGAIGKGLAGLVHLGGKDYPQAFLHRAITDKELPYLEKLASLGESSTKPMTFNAPNYPFTFAAQQRPAGLVFDAPEGAIKKMWPRDAWTQPTKEDLVASQLTPDAEKALMAEPGTRPAIDLLYYYDRGPRVRGKRDALLNKLWDENYTQTERLADYFWGTASSDTKNALANAPYHIGVDAYTKKMIPRFGEEAEQWLNLLGEQGVLRAYDKAEKLGSLNNANYTNKYKNPAILDAVRNSFNKYQDFLPKENIYKQQWDTSGFKDKTLSQQADLNDYLNKILEVSKAENRGPEWINHGEIIGDYGPNTLAGVRLSPVVTGKEYARPFVDFAKRYGLPVYLWDSSALNKNHQIDLLDEIIHTGDLGKWGSINPDNISKSTADSFNGVPGLFWKY